MDIERHLLNEIRSSGPISLDDFMEAVLSKYYNSYYRAKNPLGEKKDFITSPEVSQMFGEMIALWVYNQWIISGKGEVNLAELGPGRGVLMRDIISVLDKTDMKNHYKISFVEVNEELIKEQKKILSGKQITWIKNPADIMDMKNIFIANEFFDALPIKQYHKVKSSWKELVINSNEFNDSLLFDKKVVTDDLNKYLNDEYPNAKDGANVEESIRTIEIIKLIAENVKKYNSSALIIDYGYDIDPKKRKSTQFYSTLQALRDHKYVPVLDKVGTADITAHVDFNAIKKAVKQRFAYSSEVISQREFLLSLGIELRLNELKKKNPELESILESQVNRLVSKDQMGELFKVIMITSNKQKFFS